MSKGIKALLAREEGKLVRQIENHETTKLEQEILGDSAVIRGKLERQEVAMKQTEANIKKLKTAVAKL
jgi:hypothetical protein